MYFWRWVELACHLVCHVVSAHMLGCRQLECCLIESIACEMIFWCSDEGWGLCHCCMLFHVADGCGLR